MNNYQEMIAAIVTGRDYAQKAFEHEDYESRHIYVECAIKSLQQALRYLKYLYADASHST